MNTWHYTLVMKHISLMLGVGTLLTDEFRYIYIILVDDGIIQLSKRSFEVK